MINIIENNNYIFENNYDYLIIQHLESYLETLGSRFSHEISKEVADIRLT